MLKHQIWIPQTCESIQFRLAPMVEQTQASKLIIAISPTMAGKDGLWQHPLRRIRNRWTARIQHLPWSCLCGPQDSKWTSQWLPSSHPTMDLFRFRWDGLLSFMVDGSFHWNWCSKNYSILNKHCWYPEFPSHLLWNLLISWVSKAPAGGDWYGLPWIALAHLCQV